MMAANLTATLGTDYRLSIEGTENADQVVIQQNNGTLSIQGLKIIDNKNGGKSVSSISAAAVSGIVANLFGGNDFLDMRSTAIAASIYAGNGNDIAYGGGRHVLQYGGFAFPWPDDLLVPATKVLGAKELASEGTPQLVQTDDWLLLSLAPWTVSLRIEKAGRFPQVESIIPRASQQATKLVLAEPDAVFLRQALSALPGRGEQHLPVTLDLNGHVAIRGQDNPQTPPTELILSQSRREGEQLCVT